GYVVAGFLRHVVEPLVAMLLHGLVHGTGTGVVGGEGLCLIAVIAPKHGLQVLAPEAAVFLRVVGAFERPDAKAGVASRGGHNLHGAERTLGAHRIVAAPALLHFYRASQGVEVQRSHRARSSGVIQSQSLSGTPGGGSVSGGGGMSGEK